MNQDSSPITPPPELVQQWFLGARAMPVDQWVTDVATQAARWGADQELKACCEWLVNEGHEYEHVALRDDRRPKPPSLKELALAAHGAEPLPEAGPTGDTILNAGAIERHRLIRRALEQLND